MIEGIITRKGGGGSSTKAFPNFSYTGENFIQPLGTGRNAFNALWLTSSGTLNFTKNVYADVFLVGGGGGGGSGTGGTASGHYRRANPSGSHRSGQLVPQSPGV